MCGIAGIVSSDPAELPYRHERLPAMTGAIRHRGPDDDGHLVEPGVALGMRRLSIIDVAGSSQPLANEDESVWTVFNGEIYEYAALRESLAARGHQLRTEGDTETIVHLYEEHGVDFPRHLRGMFGIAVWDRPRRRFVLTRDRMGVKPLYYVEGPWGLAFASEVKSLIAGGLVEPALDPESAELFLALGYVPGPATLFAGVRKLLPATTLVWEQGRPAGERTYWTPWDAPPARRGTSWEDDSDQLLELLRRATRARMVADVPLGVMLSGGLDSSLICALMAEASPRPVETFSIGFEEEPQANELADAAVVAEAFGTNHHPLTTSGVDDPDLLDDALWHMEEPTADVSPLGFLLLSRLTRESVTVALSGQGADELLGGYRKHQVAAAASILARAPGGLRALAERGTRVAGSSELGRGLAVLAARDPAGRQLAMSRLLGPREREELLQPGFRMADAEPAIAASILRHVPDRELSVLGETLELDRRLALVDLMFLYFDKTSMAASLEVRVPFMDHDVVSFCASLPDGRKVSRGRRKELLKRVGRGVVPDRIVDKPKQAFFRDAVGAWLNGNRDGVVRETLFDQRARDRGQLRPEQVALLAGAAASDGGRAARQLLAVFLLERWQRIFVDADGPARRLAASAAAESASPS
jgi:asparagine synthase (glutamine-hydrolysing)